MVQKSRGTNDIHLRQKTATLLANSRVVYLASIEKENKTNPETKVLKVAKLQSSQIIPFLLKA